MSAEKEFRSAESRFKIDAHTHIVNEQIKNEYFSRTSGYAVVLQFLPQFESDAVRDDSLGTVARDERLFLCPCIDISRDIPPQLKMVEEEIPRSRIVGLKIYLTYQRGRADDEKMRCIYDFASEHRLSVTYHTGSCSLVLPSDGDLEGSNAKYVARMAEKYPDVNFIVAHMDDPRYDECIRVIHDYDNIYTDFSGAYEPGTKEGADMQWAIDTFARAIDQYPDTYKKMLYGTDFCPPINLSAIDEYDYTIEKIFAPEHFDDIYYGNALRAFPKLGGYLKGNI